MNKEQLPRRAFLQGASLAGLSAPFLAPEAVAAEPQRPALGQARPVVIASANYNQAPDGSIFNGGIDCVTKAMSILKAGGDTLDAVARAGSRASPSPARR